MESVQKIYRCVIVDDNLLDRLTAVSFIRQYSFLNISGIFESAVETLEAAKITLPDVLFLDVDMPGMSGLELRRHLEEIPACIFITAYPDYALPAFDVNALDFLVKPLNAERFDRCMSRLLQFLNIQNQAKLLSHELDNNYLFIKDGHQHIRIHLSDILYLEALKDYTGIITPEKKYCVLSPLGNLLQEPSFRHFVRIHRSYAVQKSHVQQFSSHELSVGNSILPVGRIYKEALRVFLTSDI